MTKDRSESVGALPSVRLPKAGFLKQFFTLELGSW